LYHLGNGDFSNWFRLIIKDNELADDAAQIEQNQSLEPRQSRAAVRAAIEKRYTAAPAEAYSSSSSPISSSHDAQK
jgi:hypothetical protein